MNTLSHKSSTISAVMRGVLVGGSLTSLWQNLSLKKENATRPLCCLSMWKCNVRKGLNLQRTKEKESKWQWRHWQSFPYTHTLSNTHAQLSEILQREQLGKVKGKQTGRQKGWRERRERSKGARDWGGIGAEHRRSERKRRRETEWKSYRRRENWHRTDPQSPEGFFFPNKMFWHCLHSFSC